MGNLETKLTPYYSIVDENESQGGGGNTLSANAKSIEEAFQSQQADSLWTVKKASFNGNKNSILFEFNYGKFSHESKKVPAKHLNLAINHIKKLKVLRHPNVVRYLYSEEPANLTSNHFKCLIITESVRPLKSVIGTLSKEQIISGIYGITNGLSFLHEKAFLSHNNINENCVYLNTKQTWKLSDFELAMRFDDLSKESLKGIYEHKSKSAITPEEELEMLINSSPSLNTKSKIDLDQAYKQSPHAIDSYGWAMLVLSLLTSTQEEKTVSASSSKSFYNHPDHKQSTNSITGIIDEDQYSLDDLETFLHKDPTMRPNLAYALGLSLFELYNNSITKNNTSNNTSANSLNSSMHENYIEMSEQHSSQPAGASELQQINFDPFKIDDLAKLEEHWSQLIDYLVRIKQTIDTKTIKKPAHSSLLNERFIDFLLSPFMFFSERVRQLIFPSVLIPKSHGSRKNYDYLKAFFQCNLKQLNESNKSKSKEPGVADFVLEPFIDLDKYKALVLPRIINLFSMRSTQIRIVILEYFPFYVELINDVDTLRYEILPELLIGLKENNDRLVSLTFCCLSIMVQLLGSEIVVGPSSKVKSKKNTKPTKYFSDNIPKTITYSEPVARSPTKIKSMPLQDKTSLLNLTASLDDDLMSNIINPNDDTIIKRGDKVFSDSMIALHDENGSTNDSSSIHSKNEIVKSSAAIQNGANIKSESEQTSDDNDDDGDDWSTDFGWSSKPELNSKQADTIKPYNETTPSLVSLAGSELVLDRSLSQNGVPATYAKNSGNKENSKYMGVIPSSNDDTFSSLDIKNLNIKKVMRNEDDDLIESFLNEITPKIEKKSPTTEKESEEYSVKSNGIKSSSSLLSDRLADQNGNSADAISAGKWDCDEITDLED